MLTASTVLIARARRQCRMAQQRKEKKHLRKIERAQRRALSGLSTIVVLELMDPLRRAEHLMVMAVLQFVLVLLSKRV